MEIPKKIYIDDPTGEFNDHWSIYQNNDSIEYTRTDTLTDEVKEVDLAEEIDYEDYNRFFKEHPDYNDGSWGFEETWTFAQYWYTLGLKAQKGE